MTARKTPAKKRAAAAKVHDVDGMIVGTEQASQPQFTVTPGGISETTGESNSRPNTPRPVWEAGESRSEYHAKVRAWKLEQAR